MNINIISEVLEQEKKSAELIKETEDKFAAKLELARKSIIEDNEMVISKTKEKFAAEIKQLEKKLESKFSKQKEKTDEKIQIYESITDKKIDETVKKIVKVLQ